MWGFNDPVLNEEFKTYYYQRNKQLYEFLIKRGGHGKEEASELFDLTISTIKTMWKNHRHLYPEYYQHYQTRQGS